MTDILKLHEDGMTVDEIADTLGLSKSRVYFIINRDKVASSSELYSELINDECDESEAFAIIEALSREKIKSYSELVRYSVNHQLEQIGRIGPQRADRLRAIIERRNQ